MQPCLLLVAQYPSRDHIWSREGSQLSAGRAGGQYIDEDTSAIHAL